MFADFLRIVPLMNYFNSRDIHKRDQEINTNTSCTLINNACQWQSLEGVNTLTQTGTHKHEQNSSLGFVEISKKK